MIIEAEIVNDDHFSHEDTEETRLAVARIRASVARWEAISSNMRRAATVWAVCWLLASSCQAVCGAG